MKKYLDVLKKVNLFKGIDESDLLSLLACLSSKLEHYKKNEIVFMSGEAINSFGIVLSGEVQIVQEDYYGNRSILARIGVGNLLPNLLPVLNRSSSGQCNYNHRKRSSFYRLP